MNRARILPLVLVFGATSAVAQNISTAHISESTSWTHVGVSGVDCPIGMQASHGASVPVAMNARGPAIVPAAPVPTRYQRIHLTMTNLASRDIVGAQLTAHGYSDKWKAIDLENASQTPDLAKTLEVALDMKGNGNASSDLSLSHFTAVTSIDLNSIQYADGSMWHAASAGACSVAPSLVMQVALGR